GSSCGGGDQLGQELGSHRAHSGDTAASSAGQLPAHPAPQAGAPSAASAAARDDSASGGDSTRAAFGPSGAEQAGQPEQAGQEARAEVVPELDGQVALVTGGGRGIGANIARELADAGARVAVAARTREQVEAVADDIGGLALELDVSDHG